MLCLSSGFDMRVNSSSHQGKWVSAIALLAADPTMVRTAGAAKRCRTTTDNFNLFPYFKVEMIFFHSFNVKMISLFNFNKQLANSKPFPEQYSIPDETKDQDSICIPRTSSTTFFCNKLHLFCSLFLLGPCPHHLRVLPHLCSIEDCPLKSMDIGCGRHQLLVGLESRLWFIGPRWLDDRCCEILFKPFLFSTVC